MDVFELELSKVGAPYLYAAFGPSRFDCVGLQKWAFRQAGREDLVDNSYTVGHLADMYRFTGRASSNIGSALAGDIIVYGTYEHVALKLRDGQVIAAEVLGVRVHALLDTWRSSTQRMPPTLVLRTGYLASISGTTPPAPAPPPVVVPTYRLHKVAPRETLWGIAAEYLGRGARYLEIQALNVGVIPADPHLLRAGTIIRIPLE
jgi:cell wall-associated NlpC family hydrolase